jgi:hypothetical protein
MKNINWKNFKKAIAFTAIIFIGMTGAVSADSFLKKSGGTVDMFQLSPKPLEDELSTPLPDLGFFTSTYNMIFRVYGTSLLDTVMVNNDASFDSLFAGFTTLQPSSDAKLNVNGRIKIAALADPSAPELEPVCTNDFGKLERCSTVAVTPPTVQCGTAAGVMTPTPPTTNLCNPGTASVVQLVSGFFNWTCSDASTSVNCSARQVTPLINGTCGSADGTTVSSAPTTNLCATGNPTAVSPDADSFDWTCNGVGGGTTSEDCSADLQVASCLAPTLDSLVGPNQVNFDINGETDATATAIYSSTDGVTWSGASTAGYSSPRTRTLVDGSYYKMKTICSGSIYSDDSNVLQYTAGVGACEGTYTTSGTSTKVDWDGNPLNWEQTVLYNDAKQPIYRCSEGWLGNNIDIYHITGAPYDTSSGSDLTDNYYCQYIGGSNQLNYNGSYSCTMQGYPAGQYILTGGGPNNGGLSSTPQGIKQQLCEDYSSTLTAYRFWSPGNSGNWSQYITAAGTSFYPGYVTTMNGYQGALTANVGGGTTMQCSNLTSYGQSYCETNPANAGCTWNPNA